MNNFVKKIYKITQKAEKWGKIMKIKNLTKFHISGLNQEKLLSQLCKQCPLSDIERNSKSDTTFKCSYFDHRKVEKFLKSKNVKIESVTHEGYAHKFFQIFTSYGLIAAFAIFSVLYVVQAQFVLQYCVIGLDKLTESEIVSFVKQEFPAKKSQINTKLVETALIDNFPRISFVSCIIRGQTLVLNIKEKLMPDEMYGSFSPLVAKKDGRISEINLISGTLNVKVGDFVRAGDILVEPFTIDTSGQVKQVEAKAEIVAQVYNEGSVDHYETYVEVVRTGRKVVQNDITLFGLSIYTFKEELNFQMYETEVEDVDLSKNLFLPFKMRKTTFFELEQHTVITKFEDVKDEFVAKAKEKALEKCENYQLMKEEFFTIRELAGVTIVNFCIVTEEDITCYDK